MDRDPSLSANLIRHVDRLAGLIGPRHLGNPRAFAAAAGLVEKVLADAGYKIARQSYVVHGQEVANIVAELPGERRKDGILVVGAHYDTVDTTPGADDNASAVAVMLEVARMMRNERPERTVRFIGFACEEPPHFYTGEMGSQVYARDCRMRDERIVGMLCLEMVGYFSSEPGSQKIPHSIPRIFHPLLPNQGDFLAAVANPRSWRLLWRFRKGFRRASRMRLLPLVLPEAIHEIRLSDNSSFWDQAYPALMITDTSFLRNPNYHLASDTPDTLDYMRMSDGALGILGGVAAIAGVP
jgi:Zn-dependent M28 family amino/carboxypeptidase